jgi:hypothetical protein
LEAAAEVSALIAEVSRYGNYPVIRPHSDLRAARVIRVRFPSGSYRAETAEGLTGAYADRDDVHGHDAGEPHARNSAEPGPGRRVGYGRPPPRRNAGEHRMTQATVRRSRHDDDGP